MSGETEVLVWILAGLSVVAVLGVMVSSLAALTRHRGPTGDPDPPPLSGPLSGGGDDE